MAYIYNRPYKQCSDKEQQQHVIDISELFNKLNYIDANVKTLLIINKTLKQQYANNRKQCN